MGKIKVLVIYTDKHGGVGFYRSSQPHEMLKRLYPKEFDVEFMTEPSFSDLSVFDEYNLIHFHKGVYYQTNKLQETFTKALQYFKEKGIVTVMDIDDYWRLQQHHPLYTVRLMEKNVEDGINTEDVIKKNLSLVDYVTTTTPLFANEIKKFNKNVVVIPNAINPEDKSFIVNKEPSEKLRIGMVMGSAHEYDVMTMENFVGKLPKDVLDKVQFVLCGFDTRGVKRRLNPQTKQMEAIASRPEESVWCRYEKIMTNNYQIVSPEYKNFLLRYAPNLEFPGVEKETYRRCWTRTMDSYFQHYANIDVLLAPLEENDFNKVKSELKAIECCFSHTAFVGSNFGPYTLGLKPLIEKGGNINPDGNAILIDRNKAHKDWAKTIERLVKHPEYVKMLQDNLYRDFHEKYDLRNVTAQRAEFYKKITNKE